MMAIDTEITINEQLKTNLLLSMISKDIRTITELSEKTGVSRPTLTKITKGRAKNVSLSTLMRISYGLNIDVNELLGKKVI